MHWIYQFTFNQWVEFVASSAGFICVLLASRKSIWNFFFGVINSASFFVLFHDEKIYADMMLHLIYIGFQLYGFYEWKFGGKKHKGASIVTATRKELFLSLLAILFLASILYFVLADYTNSTCIPLDATTTAMSLVASWMLARKWIENWWLWMVMDALAVVMMLDKGLLLSAGLYFLYVILCIYGIIVWRKDFNQHIKI